MTLNECPAPQLCENARVSVLTRLILLIVPALHFCEGGGHGASVNGIFMQGAKMARYAKVY